MERDEEFSCYIDVGGTFTDCFVIDREGRFYLSKAPSTPHNVAMGTFEAMELAAQGMGMDKREFFSRLNFLGFGSTIVLNALLTRRGRRCGMLITKGFEDLLLMERGKQTWTEYDRIDRMHPVTHRHVAPLIPKTLIRGVTERIDALGKPIISLYEHEVAKGVTELIGQGIEALVICFLWSFLNDDHERRAANIAKNIITEAGNNIPIFLSVDISPVLRELSRANATIIEASTSHILIHALNDMENILERDGFRGTFQIMQSSGGLTPPRHLKAVETLQSGPVGGLLGSKFVGEMYGHFNIIGTDMGGTSFDVGLVNKGEININREPVVARFILGMPTAEILSIGAGGGTIAYIDQLTGRLGVGPESAGADPGPVSYGKGGSKPTVTDADLVLGYINPDYFIGGRIKLNKQKAEEALKKQIADPLKIELVEAAWGVREIIDIRMKETIMGLIAARGLEISNYLLLGFGGAGPVHIAGYTKDLPLKGILTFPYSSVFSAFGASTSPYQRYFTKALNMIVPPFPPQETKLELGQRINKIWTELEGNALSQVLEEGFSRDEIFVRYLAQIRFGRQLQDLIVTSPVSRINSVADWDALIMAFEKDYSEQYSSAAKYPEAGYEILDLSFTCSVYLTQPKIKKREKQSEKPSIASIKGTRQAFFNGQLYATTIYHSKGLIPGNLVKGPAIIEDPTTTFVIPPAYYMEMDEYSSLWLKRA